MSLHPAVCLFANRDKNILLHLISQLRPGMDLTRVTLPTFVLEPKSMLERITNFMQHPELLLEIPTVDDPEKRFIEVVRFYLSGFHILPPVRPVCLYSFMFRAS